MTWWDAVKNWYAGKREEPFPTPSPETPDREVKYTGAADWLSKRANLTTIMGSKELAAEWTEKARAQAFFSARVAEGHILDRLRKVSDAFSRGEIGQAEARTELKKFLIREGYDPKQAGLRNLASTARLNLILEQNARMSAAVGQYQAGMDPDIKERFPCWRYIGSTALVPRDTHARFAGKVFRKDDPIWHKIFPPSDFNCKCSVEDCDDEPDEAPQDVESAESGFSFDPAHAFESFDLSDIHDDKLREKTKIQLQDTTKPVSISYRELQVEKALLATEKNNLAIFGEEYSREEQEIQKRVDRVLEKLKKRLEKAKNEKNYWQTLTRVTRRQLLVNQIHEDMRIRHSAETIGKSILNKAIIKTNAEKNVAVVAGQIKVVLENCISSDIVTENMVLSAAKIPRATSSSRSFYSLGDKTLNLNTHPGARGKLATGIHESMHWIEDFNGHVHKRCVEFLEYRCKGESAQSLKKLTGLGYRAHERARPDKFFNPYCGKDYISNDGNRYATEVLSMGVEQMLKDPVSFAKQDPEYFNFVVSIMKGEI